MCISLFVKFIHLVNSHSSSFVVAFESISSTVICAQSVETVENFRVKLQRQESHFLNRILLFFFFFGVMSVLFGPWWKWSTENQTNPAYAPTTAYYLKEHPSRRLFCVDVTEMDPTLCATELSIEWKSNRINEDKLNNGERETGHGKKVSGIRRKRTTTGNRPSFSLSFDSFCFPSAVDFSFG